jgi:hypothetical protein
MKKRPLGLFVIGTLTSHIGWKRESDFIFRSNNGPRLCFDKVLRRITLNEEERETTTTTTATTTTTTTWATTVRMTGNFPIHKQNKISDEP